MRWFRCQQHTWWGPIGYRTPCAGHVFRILPPLLTHLQTKEHWVRLGRAFFAGVVHPPHHACQPRLATQLVQAVLIRLWGLVREVGGHFSSFSWHRDWVWAVVNVTWMCFGCRLHDASVSLRPLGARLNWCIGCTLKPVLAERGFERGYGSCGQ